MLMRMSLLGMLTMMAGGVMAVDQPFPTTMQAESLPMPVVAKTVVVSQTAVVSATSAPVDSTFVVVGVVATPSGTAGFDRDAALEQAARQALPVVLTRLGTPKDKVAGLVKGLGSAFRFVASFRVVKEALVPSYSLTVDLTFNEPMVRANFGGLNKPVSDTTVGAGAEQPVPASANHWLLRLAERDPAAVNKVFATLNGQAGTKVVYRLVTSAGVEMVVVTPMSAQRVQELAGAGAEVIVPPVVPGVLPMMAPVSATGGA